MPLDEEVVGKIVRLLMDDSFRQGGSLTETQILRTFEKRHVTFEDASRIRKRLVSEGITIVPILGEEEETQVDQSEIPAGSDAKDSLGIFLGEIGKENLLTAQEERDLTRLMRSGSEFSRETERWSDERSPEAPASDAGEARSRIVRANLKLVVNIAKRYAQVADLDLLDLVQEGTLGLMRAIELFDPGLGYKFSTYATWWIRQAVTRAISDKGRTIRIPVHVVESLRTLGKAKMSLMQEHPGVEATVPELAKHLGWEVEKVEFLNDVATQKLSLDAERSGEAEGGSPLLGALQTGGLSPEEYAIEDALMLSIAEALDGLSAREAEIVRGRFGLSGREPETLEQLGSRFGVTRERIRQLEMRAFKKLRSKGRADLLKDYLSRLDNDMEQRSPETQLKDNS